MSRTAFYFLILVCILISCSGADESEDKRGASAQEVEEVIPNDNILDIPLAPNEYPLGRFQLLEVETLEGDCSLTDMMGWELDENELAKDPQVFRMDSTIVLIPEDLDSVFLTNTAFNETEQNYETAADYYFQGSVSGIDYWWIFVICYECHYNLVISKKDGRIHYLDGRPIVSPNSKLVFCANPDIESGYTINNMELYSVQESHLELEGDFELPDWGVYEADWESDTSLIIKKAWFENNWEEKTECARFWLR